MMRHKRLDHRFVKHIPERLEAGILYVSMEYATSAHSCCCGCGEEVVTPITPTDWKMTFDGEAVSLSPSIGNWNLRCSSHYFIEQGRVIEALPQSGKEIFIERRGHGIPQKHNVESNSLPTTDASLVPDRKWSWIRRWISKLR